MVLADKRKREKLIRYTIAIVISLLISTFISQLMPFKKIEFSFYDVFLKIKNSTENKKNWDVVIVDISDQAGSEIPDRWPWPRKYYSKLIDNLNKAGAKAIGFDLVLDVESKDDRLLRKKIDKYKNVVLATKLTTGNVKTIIIPSEKIISENTKYGYVNMWEDPDNVVREYVPTTFFLGESLNSFASSLYKLAFKNNTINNRFLIDYYGPSRTIPYVSFELVIDDKNFRTNMEKIFKEDINSFENSILKNNVFKNKIVVVGSSMEELQDISNTPLDPSTPGVEIHANAIQSMIDKRFIIKLPFYIKVFIYLLSIILISYLTIKYKAVKGILFLFLYIILYGIIAFLIFKYAKIYFNTAAPSLLSISVYVGSVVAIYINENKDKQLITNMFSHYLPSTVVGELIKDPSKMKLGGERRIMSVLFSDVESFTSISENMPPEQLVLLLNEYLSAMSEIVFNNKGIIDKYEGDAIMAEFGIPLSLKDHSLLACKTALEMQAKLSKLREKWKTEKKPQLKARIGISSGLMNFGNMGSDKIFDYTVMGDKVNLGSRLEGVNKIYGSYIMINSEAYENAKEHILAREIDLIVVKGKIKPERIYNLMALKNDPLKEPLQKAITEFESGLHLYRKQNWLEGIRCFKNVLDIIKDDKPSRVFIERCNYFMKSPPEKDWNGVSIMKTK